MSKQVYWYKRIPPEHQPHLNNLAKFKISLTRYKNKKEQQILKSMLNLKVVDIFNNIDKFDLSLAKQYLKKSIDETILQINNISL